MFRSILFLSGVGAALAQSGTFSVSGNSTFHFPSPTGGSGSSSAPSTSPPSSSVSSTSGSPITSNGPSGVTVITVAPATDTPTTTFTDTSISINLPSNIATSVIVTNPSNPTETATFTKETLPQDERSNLPHIDDAAPLALLLFLGGAPTFVTITSAFEIVLPIGTLPAAFTLALFPDAADVPDPDDGDDGDNNSSSSSDESSCSTKTTVSSCVVSVFCPTTVQQKRDSSCTTTTSCEATSGCSVTATTTTTTVSSTATASSYIVYPNDGTNTGQTDAITTLLGTFADTKDIDTSDTKDYGINYWTLPLTSDNVTDLSKNSDIASVSLAGCDTSCFDPSTAIVRQANAEDGLVFLSQEEGEALAVYGKNYFYDESAGSNVNVYIVDSGATIDHEEFTGGDNIAQRARWIFADPQDTTQADYGYGKYHGTCMLSRAGGHIYGTAKKINPIVVKVNYLTAGAQAFVDAMGMVLEDIRNNPGTKAVVPAGWISRLFFLLSQIEREGAFMVTGSGNNGASSIDGYPAKFGSDQQNPHVDSLLVVGAVDPSTGDMWGGSNYDNGLKLPHVFAPGTNVMCADGINLPGHEYRTGTGTSIASAVTAGLAAYLMGVGSLSSIAGSPGQVKSLIMFDSWKRAQGGPVSNGLLGLWNGIKVSDIPASCSAIAKRDGTDPTDLPAACSCTSCPSNPTSPPTTVPTTGPSTAPPSSTVSSNSSSISASSTSSSSSSSAPSPSSSLTCGPDITSSDFTNKDVANAITANNGVESMCSTTFGSSQGPNEISYNTGSIGTTIERDDSNRPLQHCQEGINAIINSCINDQNKFGGVWEGDGETYNITNLFNPPSIPGTDTFPSASSSVPPSTSASPTSTAYSCVTNQVSAVPTSLLSNDDPPVTLSPNDLLYRLRQVVCGEECGSLPSGVPSADVSTGQDGDKCGLAVALPGNVQAMMYRGTAANGSELQECWDETQHIIDDCINSQPNLGWANGPDDFQFYQGGFMSLNAAMPGSISYSTFDGSNVMPTPTPTTVSCPDGCTPAGGSFVIPAVVFDRAGSRILFFPHAAELFHHVSRRRAVLHFGHLSVPVESATQEEVDVVKVFLNVIVKRDELERRKEAVARYKVRIKAWPRVFGQDVLHIVVAEEVADGSV
ncbi:hypothetical protein NA57DRAFT_72031 [Rhizodiscina lignyota]|uniref:Subtilisin n=1 Tax=Rhizodiscina lignyota TaxID=1504668 RepID=A0A9P4M9U2_9PEZI|nr:hypothetical protein NA57DRAFT_72031 [Rhizodiscina lignyota]